MYFLKIFIFCTVILLSINKLLTDKKILLHSPDNHNHKDKFKKKIPLSGGLYFFICFFFLSIITNYNYLYIMMIVICFPMLLIGILADVNYDLKPILRLFYSFIIILSIVFFLNISINKIDIILLDYYLNNKFISVLFTSFCILILVNGYNFIDGTHGNLALYNITIFFFVFFSAYLQYSNIEFLNKFLYFAGTIIIFIVFTIFNFFKKNFMGDNGSYYLGTLTGILVILVYKNNNFSSIYVVNILIYPALEVLWSIIRKYWQNKKIEQADRLHLHHLILDKLSLKLSKDTSSIITSIIIFIINFVFIFSASMQLTNGFYQIKILILYVLFYTSFNLILLRKKK